jgi:hypothetical protein
MVVKIRLSRFGKRHQPVYNIVVSQARYDEPPSFLFLDPVSLPFRAKNAYLCVFQNLCTSKTPADPWGPRPAPPSLQNSTRLETNGSPRHLRPRSPRPARDRHAGHDRRDDRPTEAAEAVQEHPARHEPDEILAGCRSAAERARLAAVESGTSIIYLFFIHEGVQEFCILIGMKRKSR